MVGHYESFFITSAGASAAILGLLVVAASVVFGVSSLAMAVVGLVATRRLIPRAKRAGNFSRNSRSRTLNIAFASISVAS
jgi:hypothetical protein